MCAHGLLFRLFIHAVIISKQESQPCGDLPIEAGKNTSWDGKSPDFASCERTKAFFLGLFMFIGMRLVMSGCPRVQCELNYEQLTIVTHSKGCRITVFAAQTCGLDQEFYGCAFLPALAAGGWKKLML
jgi:hypothetical protein